MHRSAGLTLIELMVALAIGSLLMIGAFAVFIDSRSTLRLNESLARLQENARYVFDAIEPDIRMASYFGLRTRGYAIDGRAAPTEARSPLAARRDCGPNWSVDLAVAVAGSNDSYAFQCAPSGGAMSAADTLTIRRVATEPVAVPEPGTLYVQSTRDAVPALFAGPARPPAPASSQTHALVVNGYYVSRRSIASRPGEPLPSLRRKYLRAGAAGPVVADEEVLPGVEDLQIRFGIDTDPPGSPGRGAVDRYAQPDDPVLDRMNAAFDPAATILTVRIWLRLRSEVRVTGRSTETMYRYAGREAGPFRDGYPRLVATKTIYLRNARPAP